MNDIQKIIYQCAKEGSQLWEIILEIQSVNTKFLDTKTGISIVAYPHNSNIKPNDAIELFKNEYDFIKSNNLYLLKTKKLYDNNSLSILDSKEILKLTMEDVSFNQNGPFYYLSDDVRL
jgi:hypothetical protein